MDDRLQKGLQVGTWKVLRKAHGHRQPAGRDRYAECQNGGHQVTKNGRHTCTGRQLDRRGAHHKRHLQ